MMLIDVGTASSRVADADGEVGSFISAGGQVDERHRAISALLVIHHVRPDGTECLDLGWSVRVAGYRHARSPRL